MTNAKKFDKLIIIEDGIQKELTDVMVVPIWLLKSILKSDDDIMTQDRSSFTEYGQGVYDTIKEQNTTLSINTVRK